MTSFGLSPRLVASVPGTRCARSKLKRQQLDVVCHLVIDFRLLPPSHAREGVVVDCVVCVWPGLALTLY